MYARQMDFVKNPNSSPIVDEQKKKINQFEQVSEEIRKFTKNINQNTSNNEELKDYEILQKASKALTIGFRDMASKNIFGHSMTSSQINRVLGNIEKYIASDKYDRNKLSFTHKDVDEATNIVDETEMIGFKYNKQFNRTVFLLARGLSSIEVAKMKVKTSSKDKVLSSQRLRA